jgi:NAD-dependent DNA ligase
MTTLKNKKNKSKTIKLKNLKINSYISNMNGGNKDYKEEYIEILKQLEYYNRKHEKAQFKAKIYREAAEQLKNYKEKINSSKNIKDLPGIGKAITDKLDEYIKSGKIKNLEELKKKYGTKEYQTEKIKQEKKDVFLQIPWIGDATAEKIIELNINTIDELKQRQNEEIPGKGKKKVKLLNDSQKKGLIYYEQIAERIPRKEIDDYKELLTKIFNETCTENGYSNKTNKFEIVGSYRRGKPDSGDIDIFITSDEDDKTIFNKFLEKMDDTKKDEESNEAKIIKAFLTRGEKKVMVIGKLSEKNLARRLDFLYSPPEEYAFAILYFTGSMEFNTAMRQHALQQGLTLNEHGFHKMENKIKGDKITSVTFNSEKDIFDYLNLEFKEPNERIDGNSVIIKKKSSKKEQPPDPAEQPPDPAEQPLVPAEQPPALPEPKKESPIEQDAENVGKAEAVFKADEKKGSPKTMKIKISKSKTETLKKIGKKTKEKIIFENIQKFKTEGIDTLKSLSEEELTDMLKESIQKYYQETEESLLSDNQYDILREYILKKYPNNKTANTQHAEVKLDKNKVKLPYEMWSMDKIKPDTKELEKFKSKYSGPYVISCKLDGVSALYSTEEDSPKLYTRGDGKYGQLIDHLIEHLNLPTTKNITLRGELIIKEKLFQEKYSTKYSNSRNFISGIVNKKKLTKEDISILKDIDFVGYEVIKPENLKPSEQLNLILSLNSNCVKFMDSLTSKQLTNEFLSEKLVDWRSNYEYTIDGIICIDDKVYTRESKNPTHAFAFKMVLSDQSAEAKVLNVLWNASKDGFLKPRVQIEEVNIGGAKINYATGFNAKFIEDNKIGIGAVIKIIRSGDVIPKIEEIITPAETALMPKEKYTWNETHVDIMLENKEDDETVKLKNIAGFFKAIEVEGLGEANIKKIIKVGGNSIGKIIAMTISDLMKVEGFKEKMATKIYNSIQKQITKSSLATIAGASNIFGRGFGEKRIELILKELPNILTENSSNEEKINKLKIIDGLGSKTSRQFVENIPEFIKFINEAKLDDKLSKKESPKKSQNKQQPLINKIVLLSDVKGKKKITEKIEKLGGEVVTNISKNVNLLIVGSLHDETSKMKKAKEYNIEIISIEEFDKKY